MSLKILTVCLIMFNSTQYSLVCFWRAANKGLRPDMYDTLQIQKHIPLFSYEINIFVITKAPTVMFYLSLMQK